MFNRPAALLVALLLVACFGPSCSDEPATNNEPAATNNDPADAGAANNASTHNGDLPDASVEDEDAGDPGPAPPSFGARGRAGSWHLGDLHVHATGASNDTGGDNTPERIKEVALERGLSFVALTDHSNSTGSDPTTRDEDPALFNMGPEFPYWDRAAMLTEAGVFLMVDGNELSPVAAGDAPREPRGHIGCIPRDLANFELEGAFVDRPRGEVSGGESLAQALERGCFAIINHPYAPAVWITYDWTMLGEGYHAMEVWNGGAGWDFADRAGMDALICDHLTRDHYPTPIAASDNHRVNEPIPGGLFDPPLGFPHTGVFVAELTWPAIMEALEAGRVVLRDHDNRIDLDVHDAAGGWLGMVGDVLPVGEAAWVQVHAAAREGYVHDYATVELLMATPESCSSDPRPASSPPVVEEIVLGRWELAPGESLQQAVHLQDIPSGSLLRARLVPPSELATEDVALTGLIRLQ